MSNTIIQAIKVNLQGEYTEDATIGLYTASGASYLRVSEATLTGTTLAWTPGLILKGGIGDIDASGSLERGGNIADYSGLRVSLANAEKLMQSLKDLQINIIGLPVTVHEFVGTIADSDSVSEDTIFTGVVENIAWGDTIATINLKNSLYKRETNLSSVAENGVTIPVTFGKMYPPDTTVINNLAKFVRSEDEVDETIYNNAVLTDEEVNPEITIFPAASLIIDGSAPYYMGMNIAVNGTPSSNFSPAVVPEDVFLKIVSGGGSGKYYPVTSIEAVPSYIRIEISGYMYPAPSSSGSTRSWVKLVKINRLHKADTWPCKEFKNATDGTAILTPEVYTYNSDNKVYDRIADLGFSVSTTDKNTIDIDGSQCSTDVDTIESSVVLPVTSLAKVSSLDGWTDTSGFDLDLIYTTKHDDGIFYNAAMASSTVVVTNDSLTNPTYAYDQGVSSYAEFSPTLDVQTVDSGRKYCLALKFGLPKAPLLKNISGVCIGIKMKAGITENLPPPFGLQSIGGNLSLLLRRFAYTQYATDGKKFPVENVAIVDPNFNDIPEKYYVPIGTDGNKYYSIATAASGGKWTTAYGYSNYQITDDIEVYNTFVEGAIILEGEPDNLVRYYDNFLKIYELCIIFNLDSGSIKKEIFSPLASRVFNDTFESRKTATDLIENPVDVIEHTRRLQNWSELGGTVVEWGKEYAANALIKLADDGSFDSPNLTYLTGQTVAMQITDSDKAKSNSLIKKLCAVFDLCSYIDQDGYECVETLQPWATAPTETILLTDQHGAIGDIEESKVENIYCEPVINYLFDQGSGEYQKSVRVTNIDATAWTAAYTPGYLLADGERIWNLCKALYTKYRHVEPCPADFSDLPCVRDYAVALAYIERKLAWMEKPHLPTLNIAYSKGKDYNIYKHVMVQLPVHTNNVLVECIIDKITKSKTRGIVQIEAAIIGEIET